MTHREAEHCLEPFCSLENLAGAALLREDLRVTKAVLMVKTRAPEVA